MSVKKSPVVTLTIPDTADVRDAYRYLLNAVRERAANRARCIMTLLQYEHDSKIGAAIQEADWLRRDLGELQIYVDKYDVTISWQEGDTSRRWGDYAMSIDVARRAVKIQEACELANVTRRTLYNWMAAGKVEWVRTAGGSRRIYVDTLFRTREGASWPTHVRPPEAA